MATKPVVSTREMLQAAEQYLAKTETYEAVTLKDLAKFLGVKPSMLYERFPSLQWKLLQRTWIESRLRKAMEDICKEGTTQEDYTIENIARYARIPFKVARRFLPENEWQARRAALPTTQVMIVFQEQFSETTHYMLQAERYLALAQQFESVTLKHFAEFLSEPEHIVRERLPFDQWGILRETWIENHVRRAMDAAYTEAQSQNDFTKKMISRYAKMPHSIVCRFLSEEEWQARRATLPRTREKSEMKHLLLAEAYLARTEQYEDVTIERFAESLGIQSGTVYRWRFRIHWDTLRHKWIEKRLREAMNALYAEARTRADFTLGNIARRAEIPETTMHDHLPKDEWRAFHETLPPKYADPLNQLRQAMERIYSEAKTQDDFTMVRIAAIADIPRHVASHYIGDEWRNRRATLPTTKEKVLTALQSLVNADTPVSELTRKRVIELANVSGEGTWLWFDQPYQAALRQLALRPRKQEINPPVGSNVRLIPGSWVDINASIWDLRPAKRHLLRRERLREDVAEVGWPLLQKELQSSDIPLSRVDSHYQGFLKIGVVLGDKVPDVRCATLETVQRAWMNFNGTKAQLQVVRPCLVMTFEALMRLAEYDATINGKEMLSISAWLRDGATVGRTEPGEEFLSESELNAVIQSCLTDIIAGIAYTDTNPDLLTVSLHPRSKDNASVMVQWATALMILVMAFTSLRRESVLGLKISDWAEVHEGLYVLAWRHNKKVEENVAVLPAELAQQLQFYVQRTSQVRSALEIESVFLGNNHQGYWEVMPFKQFHRRLHEFAERHHLKRDSILLTLSSTVFRRTYVTRALHEGRNLAALRSQLGHIHFDSTLRYAKFDQYEHPAELGEPLDEYGRKALLLWRAPLILNELEHGERALLLGVKVKREQGVGLCRYDHCTKAVEGSPPPCSLCEHLVTGPEFLVAWETERCWRKQELERLATETGSEMLFAQMKYQFERFEANFAFIYERVRI